MGYQICWMTFAALAALYVQIGRTLEALNEDYVRPRGQGRSRAASSAHVLRNALAGGDDARDGHRPAQGGRLHGDDLQLPA